MRPAEALGHVEGSAESEVLTRKRLFVSALSLPHLQAHLDGLFEDAEALVLGWIREAEALGLRARVGMAVARRPRQTAAPTTVSATQVGDRALGTGHLALSPHSLAPDDGVLVSEEPGKWIPEDDQSRT